MAEQEKLREMLEQSDISRENYEEILTEHQNLMMKLITDIEAQKEKESLDIIDKLKKRIDTLESYERVMMGDNTVPNEPAKKGGFLLGTINQPAINKQGFMLQ